MTDETAAGIGHNLPPLTIDVRSRNKDLFDELDQLAAVDALVPETITSDEDEGAAQDLVVKCRKALEHAKGSHKVEKEPYDKVIKELKSAFAIPMEKVEKTMKTITQRIDVWKEKKAAAERRRRAEEAEKQRQESERLQREAAEAERKRAEAERARLEEEAKAAEAQRQREESQRRAREEAAKAEEARKERIRLEQEARERRQREEAERKAKEKTDRERQEAEAERNVQEEKRREFERQQREQEQREHEERIAKLKAEEEVAIEKAKAEREAERKALEERRKSEAAAAEAKKAERASGREANQGLEDAIRSERRADRLDAASKAPESDLSRGRGDYGSVGSRVTRWTYTILDRDKIPLEQLRAYLHPDAIDAAVTRFMNAHRPELGKGHDRDDLLKGVEFHQVTDTRVA